jgi:hypothetical protein
MTALNSGKIGFGTATPTYNVDIAGASGLDGATPVTQYLYSTNTGTWTDEAIFSQLLFGNADTSGTAGPRCAVKAYIDDTTGADAGLSFFTTTNGSTGIKEQARITHDGKFGIGTTTPSKQFELRNDQNASTEIFVGNSDSGSNARAGIRIGNDEYDPATGVDAASIFLYSTGALRPRLFRFLHNLPTGNIDWYCGAAVRMTLLYTGQLGIGTNAPTRQLEVNEASGNCLRLIYNDSDGSPANYADFLVSSTGDLTINASGGDISFGNENLLTTGTLGAGATTVTDLTTSGTVQLGNASTDVCTNTGRMVFRTAASDPQHATPGSRPAGTVAELVYYSGKMYFCTNSATPTWQLITST